MNEKSHESFPNDRAKWLSDNRSTQAAGLLHSDRLSKTPLLQLLTRVDTVLTAVRRRQRRPVHGINEEIVNSDIIISVIVNMRISIYFRVCFFVPRISAFTNIYSNVFGMHGAYVSSPITIITARH